MIAIKPIVTTYWQELVFCQFLYAKGNNVLDKMFKHCFRQPIELLIYLPLVEQSAKRHEPNLALRSPQ